MASYVELILNEEVLLDDFLQWISGHHFPAGESSQWKLQYSRCEFALCFLNYLRDQTSRILSNDSKRCKTSQPSTEKTAPQEEVISDESKNSVAATATKITRNSICSPDKSFGNTTSDERSPIHMKNITSNAFRNSREGTVCANNSSFDSPFVTYSQHFQQRKSSPKQAQHFESSPLRDGKPHFDSPSEKSHIKSPRETWNSKNSQSTTLWDYVSKDNSLGARKKNSAENGGKDERNQDKRCGSKVNTRQKRQRRINPTRVVRNLEGSESEGLSASQSERQPFGLPQEVPPPAAAFSLSAKESSESNSSSFAEERALLREERMKMQSTEHDSTTSSPPKTSYVTRNQSTEPVLTLVTSKKQLDSLADVFAILISKNLVPNILSEMCFLCNLLTVQAYDSQSEKTSDNTEIKNREYFSSVHNCAYFAVAVLSKLRNLLQLLDRNTRRMLSENIRLVRFSPSLAAQLANDDRPPRRSILFPQNSSISSTLTSFQTDVDNRKNFPNERTFRMFCRQRDEFCEALRTWESSRSMPGWSFSVVLGPRIRSILTPSHSPPEPTNFIHLARFFRAQLLANCGNNGVTGSEESSNTGEVVPIALRDADPSKLQRLQRRLIWPSRSRGGCCPVPTFPGTQEFFRDFIICGANHMFNEHLKDGLVSDILNLNDSQFIASELEDQDKVDDDTRCAYIKCVLNMQLLAKFLGFLVFLPYQGENRLPNNIMLSYCTLRNKVMPVMDLTGLLWAAKQQRHLSITVPWMVVFLSMIDRVSSNTDYYKDKFFPFLIGVYRDMEAEKGLHPLTHAILLVRLCLGWLFEQPNFPQEAVFTDKAVSTANDNFHINGVSRNVASLKLKGPDDLDLIDELAVYTICPFLSELRMMISDSSSSRSGSGTNIVRHITPVPASDRLPAVSSSRLLELKLEENFFSNQPASVRRTVDFVSERIASTCVRHICNQLLPKALKRGLARVHNFVISKLQENSSDTSPSEGQTTEKFELTMAREIHEVSSEEWLNLKKECLEYSDCECERRAWDAIPPLLPQTGDEAVSLAICQMCVQVTLRRSRQKVRRWITSHTSAALFAKEYETEVGKLVASSQKPSEINIKSVEESDEIPTAKAAVSPKEDGKILSAAQIINHLREIILDIISAEEGAQVELQVVEKVLEVITLSVDNGSNLTPPSLKTVFTLTVDLAVFLVAHGVKMVGKTPFTCWNWDMFILLWTRLASSTDEAFARILSPRNLYLFSLVEDGGHSVGGKSSWATRLSSLLSALLSSKLLNPKQLEEQSLTVLHTAWPQEFLAQYSECIKGVLDHPEVKHCSDDDDEDVNTSALLMEWLAESCATMEILE